MENPLKKIPKWGYYAIALVALLIIGLKTRIIQRLPDGIRSIFYAAVKATDEEGKSFTQWIPKRFNDTWAAWVDLMKPFAVITADALDLLYDFVRKPFQLEDRNLKSAPYWQTLFSIAAVVGMCSTLLGFYFKYVKGNKPKAYYRDDYTAPRPKTY
jgi:hypothetical protein